MKVKMKSVYAGPLGVFQKGDIVDLPKAIGDDLVKGGYAASAPADARARHVINDEPVTAKTEAGKPRRKKKDEPVTAKTEADEKAEAANEQAGEAAE